MSSFGNLRVGTSGYVFDDWAGVFYPPRLSRKDWLKFYASEFSVVEINATYYRIPPPRAMESMALKTKPGFSFILKANREMTHSRTRSPAVYRAFEAAAAPIAQRGQLDGVLLQFPYGFRNTPPARDHLQFLADALSPHRCWVEFRHRSWNVPETYSRLKELRLGYCAVDEPALSGLMPPTVHATTPMGYVRFHGRNRESWWGGGHRRYDWEYSRGELESWLDRLRRLSRSTSTSYVFFNNCYMGQAVKSARLLQKLIGQSVPLELEF